MNTAHSPLFAYLISRRDSGGGIFAQFLSLFRGPTSCSVPFLSFTSSAPFHGLLISFFLSFCLLCTHATHAHLPHTRQLHDRSRSTAHDITPPALR